MKIIKHNQEEAEKADPRSWTVTTVDDKGETTTKIVDMSKAIRLEWQTVRTVYDEAMQQYSVVWIKD